MNFLETIVFQMYIKSPKMYAKGDVVSRTWLRNILTVNNENKILFLHHIVNENENLIRITKDEAQETFRLTCRVTKVKHYLKPKVNPVVMKKHRNIY